MVFYYTLLNIYFMVECLVSCSFCLLLIHNTWFLVNFSWGVHHIAMVSPYWYSYIPIILIASKWHLILKTLANKEDITLDISMYQNGLVSLLLINSHCNPQEPFLKAHLCIQNFVFPMFCPSKYTSTCFCSVASE